MYLERSRLNAISSAGFCNTMSFIDVQDLKAVCIAAQAGH